MPNNTDSNALNKELNTVYLTYTTLGEYLKDRDNIKQAFPDNKENEIESALVCLLENLLTEAFAIEAIKGFDLDTALCKITESHDDCVNERRKIEAAQSAEDLLQTAAIAADVALAAASWTVFGAVGLGIAALAAEAAAGGVEVEVGKLEGTITQMIADMGLKAYNEPALSCLKEYHESSSLVSVCLAKLELGGNKAIVRQSLLGLAKMSQGVYPLRMNLIHFYDVSNKPGDLIGKYTMLAELLIQGDGPGAAKIVADLKEAGEAPVFIKTAIFAVGSLGLGSTLASSRFTNQVEQLLQEDAELGIESIESVARLTTMAERMATCVKAMAFVGAALEAAMLGLTIADQRGTINGINTQIEKRKNDLVTYYTAFHEAVSAT